MADDLVKRDDQGRFQKGNPGGPGRPGKKRPPFFSMDDLSSLANMTGAELWFAAEMQKDRDEQIEFIREHFPAKIVERIENLVRLSDLATSAMVQRMISEYSS